MIISVTLKHIQILDTQDRSDRVVVRWLRDARVSLRFYCRSHRLVHFGGTELYLVQWPEPIGGIESFISVGPR